MQKVYWLLDEVFAQTHPNNWQEAEYLLHGLIGLVGNKELKHSIVNPLDSYRRLVNKVFHYPDEIRPTTIIDLSHWIGYGMKSLFPNSEIINNFSLSRILDVSTIDFQTRGYVLREPEDEVLKKARKLDLSRTMIIDDTGITGGTSKTTMKVFGIQPETATHLFLLANTGNFPRPDPETSKMGAVNLLEDSGGKVIYGDSLKIPEDDAEHLTDLFRHPHLQDAFPLARKLREATRNTQDYVWGLHKFSPTGEELENLFPQQVKNTELEGLSKEGRFLPNPGYIPGKNPLYSRNPLLWTFSNFWQKIDEQSLAGNADRVLTVLQRLQMLTTDEEGLFEIQQRLKAETEGIIKGVER